MSTLVLLYISLSYEQSTGDVYDQVQASDKQIISTNQVHINR